MTQPFFFMPVLLLLAATLFWASTFIFIKLLLADAGPYFIMVARSIITCLTLLAFRRKTIFSEISASWKSRLFWIFPVVLFFALLLQTVGLQYTTASNGAFVSSLSVLFVPILRRLHYNIKTEWGVHVSILTALAGLYLISFGPGIPSSVNTGDFYMLLSAVLYGYYILLLSELARKISGATIVFVSFLLVGALSLPAALLAGELAAGMASLADPAFMANLLVLSTLGGTLAYLFSAQGQKHVPPHLAALIYTLEPVFALFLARVILAESMRPRQLSGCALVVAALIMGVVSANRSALRGNPARGRPPAVL